MAKYTPPPPYQQQTHQQQTYQQQTHNVVVVQQQPVVVQQTRQTTQSRDFLSDLGKAFDSAANDAVKIAGTVSSDPIDLLKHGYVIQVVSKLSGKSLRVLETGLVDCLGEHGTASQFTVLSAGPGGHSIKLRNVAQPHFHLAMIKGYFVGYGQGGPESDLLPSATLDRHVTFEFTSVSGAHIGVLPSGQLTDPHQTTKKSDTSHFWIRYIRSA